MTGRGSILSAAMLVAVVLTPAWGDWDDGGGEASAGPPARGAGLHLADTKRIGFDYQMNDGAGFVWNIQYYGTVGSGTNNAYSGGMYCQVNGTNVRSNGQGWVSEAGDEVEIGPYSVHNVSAWRRIKVYKDQGLARWLDILKNTTGSDLGITVQVFSNTCWPVGNIRSVTGKDNVTDKDWAFTTQTVAGNPAPALLHVFGDKRSKLRPNVRIQNNQIYLAYNITIPANQTVILCHFESQGNSAEEMLKGLGKFRARKLLEDLPRDVRKMILNFSLGGGLDDIDLERSESSDLVVRHNGDPILGEVANETFAVKTLFGELKLPADRVLGMVSPSAEEREVRFVLSDGQVISGQPGDSPILLNLPTGGQLKIPLAEIRQWSYRITEKRPDEIKFVGPIALLRTGDRLAFDPAATQLKFRTRNGVLDLRPDQLQEIVLDSEDQGVHQAMFLNGTHLGGFLEPENVALKLRLDRTLDIPRDLLARITFATESVPDESLTHVLLTNGDELFAVVKKDVLRLETEFGTPDIKPENLQSLQLLPNRLGGVMVQLWNSSILRGRLTDANLAFQVAPGTTLNVHASQVVYMVMSSSLPPQQLMEQVAALVAKLGSESYEDREKATEALKRLDPAVAPALRKFLTTGDPEVRERIQRVLEHLEGNKGGTPTPPNPMIMMQRGMIMR